MGAERGPQVSGHFERDADAHSAFWRTGYDLLAALPEKPKRTAEQARAAETVLRAGRESREAFMLRHAQRGLCGADQGSNEFRAGRCSRL